MNGEVFLRALVAYFMVIDPLAQLPQLGGVRSHNSFKING